MNCIDSMTQCIELENLRQKVAELEKNEAAYRKEQAELSLFQSIVESSSEAIAVSDPNGKIVYVNQAHEKLFGRSRENATKLNYRDYYPPESIEILNRIVAPAIGRGEGWEGVLEAYDSEGRLFHLWERVDAIRDAQGKVIFGFGFMHDISDQKLAQIEQQRKIAAITSELIEANKRLEEEIRTRVESEEALRLSERRLAETQRVGKMGNWEWNAITNEVDWSDEMYRIFGVTPEKFHPDYNSHLKFIPAEDLESYEKTIQDCLKRKGPFEYEHRVITPDGEVKTVWVHGDIELNREGEPIGMWGTTQDITDRKRVEEGLLESESRFRRVLAQAADAIFVHDYNGNFLEVNQAACESLGYSRDELLSMSVMDVDPEAIPRQDIELYWLKLPKTFEARNVRKDGSSFPVEVSLGPIEFGNEQVILALVRDISERKKTEEQLQASEEKYRGIIENVQDLFYQTDNNGVITYVSPGVQEVTGYLPQEVLGRKLVEFYVDAKERDQLIALLMEHGAVNQFEARLITKDGGIRWASSNVKLRKDENGNVIGVQGVTRDVTDRRDADDLIKASLKEKEILLREIHHRVKNNLAIMSSLLRLQSRNAKDDFHRQMFVDAQARIKSMALAHERLYGSENLSQIDMREYIPGIVDHLAFQTANIGKKIEVKKDIDRIRLNLEMAVPIGFLINELITNSLRHAFLNLERGLIIIALTKTGKNRLELMIKDNGVGLPEGVDFQTTKSFGLNLVRLFVEQIGGNMEVLRGHGTEFRIRFKYSYYSEEK